MKRKKRKGIDSGSEANLGEEMVTFVMVLIFEAFWGDIGYDDNSDKIGNIDKIIIS